MTIFQFSVISGWSGQVLRVLGERPEPVSCRSLAAWLVARRNSNRTWVDHVSSPGRSTHYPFLLFWVMWESETADGAFQAVVHRHCWVVVVLHVEILIVWTVG